MKKKYVMKNLEIEQLALVELSETESNTIYGGRLPWWAWAIWAAAVIIAIIAEG